MVLVLVILSIYVFWYRTKWPFLCGNFELEFLLSSQSATSAREIRLESITSSITMKAFSANRAAAATLIPLLMPALGANILVSNDDGWATSNIRSLYAELNSTGHNVILSAPAENKSGSSSYDEPPTARRSPCQFNSCPAGSPPIGTDPSNPRIQYVNSYPVTAVNAGLDKLVPTFFDDELVGLVVTGVNIGDNVDIKVPFSGTVGAAVAAVKRGIPAIAFSGKSGEPASFTTQPTPSESVLYAQLASEFVEAVIAAGPGALPRDTFLNVNFPDVGGDDGCDSPEKFTFVLSRINPGIFSRDDVEICGNDGRLPMERAVIDRNGGCFVSVSVGDANDRTTADRNSQEQVVKALGGFLSCLP